MKITPQETMVLQVALGLAYAIRINDTARIERFRQRCETEFTSFGDGKVVDLGARLANHTLACALDCNNREDFYHRDFEARPASLLFTE